MTTEPAAPSPADRADPGALPSDAAQATGAATKSPPSFGRLAGTLRRRTFDLLAIGIVAVTLLGLGRTLADWWNTDPADLAPASVVDPFAGWGADGGTLRIGLGDLPCRLLRTHATATVDEAVARAVADCRSIAETGTAPLAPPDEAEANLLRTCAKLAPVAESKGEWRVHRATFPVPLLVASRRAERSAGATDGWRVLCWGLVLPAGESQWTTYLFDASRAPAGASAADVGNAIPAKWLPGGAKRTLSLSDGRGRNVLGFEGTGSAAAWTKAFDAKLTAAGWRRIGAWESAGSSWSARYADGSAPDDGTERRLQVQFAADGAWGSGVIESAPGVSRRAEN